MHFILVKITLHKKVSQADLTITNFEKMLYVPEYLKYLNVL